MWLGVGRERGERRKGGGVMGGGVMCRARSGRNGGLVLDLDATAVCKSVLYCDSK